MGILNAALTILLSPLIITTALLGIVFASPHKLTPTALRRRRRKGRLVLMAVDETSLEAVRWSLQHLLISDDFVHLLHILEPTDPPYSFSFGGGDRLERLDEIKGLGQIARELREARVSFDGRGVRAGEQGPAEMILRVITEVDPDLVILGASKRTGE